MKKLILTIALAALAGGCTTNGVYDAKKTWTLVGVVAVGAAVASSAGGSSGGGDTDDLCPIVIGGGGGGPNC